MKTEKAKKDKSIRPHVVAVLIFAVVMVVIISIPILQHRQFLKFVSDFSRVTTRTETKNVVYCEYNGEDVLLDADQKANIYRQLVYSEQRLLRPLKRVGPKGSGEFEPVGWDEALDLVARKFLEIKNRYGPDALAGFACSVVAVADFVFLSFSAFFGVLPQPVKITKTHNAKAVITDFFISDSP